MHTLQCLNMRIMSICECFNTYFAANLDLVLVNSVGQFFNFQQPFSSNSIIALELCTYLQEQEQKGKSA